MENLVAELFGGHYRDRRVLVTGATGFKGSWLCLWLRAMGAQVEGISIGTPGTPCHFEVLNLQNFVKDHRADVRDLETIQGIINQFQPEVVFHLAAQALVRQSYENPVETFTTNVIGTTNVMQAIRKCPSVQAAVVITSDKCYENVEQVPGYHENDRLGGKDPYSASKGCAELVFSAFARSYFGAPNRWVGETATDDSTHTLVASGRAGNVIGGGDWAADRIIPDCVRAWMLGERPVIRSPHATRPWQHVLEPLSGYLWLGSQLLQQQTKHHGVSYNFGPLPEVNETVLRLIQAIREHWKGAPEPDVQSTSTGKPEAGLLRLDCREAQEHLGWHATLNFEETARFTAAWYQQYQQDPANLIEVSQGQIAEYASLAHDRDLPWAV